MDASIEGGPSGPFVEPLAQIVFLPELAVWVLAGLDGQRQGERSPLFPAPTFSMILSTVRREHFTL